MESESSGGQEYLLKGSFCSYSSSSTSSSSYSSSNKYTFDGIGRFVYGSESYFSGDSGQGFSYDPNVEGGTYRVSGDTVSLTFNDGSTAAVTVNYRSPAGFITELKHGSTLYGVIC